MPKQVEKWEADTGGCFNTKEEAITEEKRVAFNEKMDTLYESLGSGKPCDKGQYDRLIRDFIWKQRGMIKALLNA